MAEVRIQDGGLFDNALRRFKRKVQQENIVKEVKRHSFYQSLERKKASSRLWPANAAARKFAVS